MPPVEISARHGRRHASQRQPAPQPAPAGWFLVRGLLVPYPLARPPCAHPVGVALPSFLPLISSAPAAAACRAVRRSLPALGGRSRHVPPARRRLICRPECAHPSTSGRARGAGLSLRGLLVVCGRWLGCWLAARSALGAFAPLAGVATLSLKFFTFFSKLRKCRISHEKNAL